MDNRIAWGLSTALLAMQTCLVLAQATSQGAPPVPPRIQETPLPPPVTLPPPPSVPADLPNAPITADEAALIALRHQPGITVAAQGVLSATGRVQQVRSALFPQVAVSAGYTRTQGLGGVPAGTTVTAVPAYQASTSLRQLIFDFNHTRDLTRQAAAEQRAATAGLTLAQANTVLQVKQEFYTMVEDRRLVTVNEANVRDQQSHLAEARARLNAGVGLPSDVVRAETAVDNAILNLNIARNNASTSQVALALAMGIDPRTPINAANTDEPVPPSMDVNVLVAAALRQRPEVIQAQESVDASRAGVSAARTTSAPILSASMGLGSRGQSFPPSGNSWSIGASLSWNPFDSGLTSGIVKQAQANVGASLAELSSARLAVTADVSQAYLNLQTAQQRVTTSDAEVANAQEGVRLAEGRYRAGIGVFIDVTDAQSALLTAQTNRVNARNAVDQARAALARAIGAGLPAAVPAPSAPAALASPHG